MSPVVEILSRRIKNPMHSLKFISQFHMNFASISCGSEVRETQKAGDLNDDCSMARRSDVKLIDTCRIFPLGFFHH